MSIVNCQLSIDKKDIPIKTLNGHINLILVDGEKIPEPSTLETILNDTDHQEAVAFMTIEISDTILTNRELCVQIRFQESMLIFS